MGLRESNKQDKRERLGRAARELFSEQGFDATTMRQIADRAGIGVGTIFLYARDKRGLLFLLFSDAVLDVQRQAFASLPTGEAGAELLVEQLVHVFSSFYRYYATDRRLSRLFVRELLFQDQPASPPAEPGAGNSAISDAEKHLGLTLEFLGRLAALVQQAQERGGLRADFSPLLAAMNFFATYFLTLVGLLDPIHGASLDAELATARLRMALQLQVSGLRREGGEASVTPSESPPQRRKPRAPRAAPAPRKRRT
jgi:AcrR family transcriptional regulator